MTTLESALAYFLAYDARDWNGLRGLLADPIRAELNGVGSDLHVDDYLAMLLATYASCPDLRTSVDRAFADGNFAVVQWRTIGTNSGPRQLPDGSTLEATGQRIALGGCDVIQTEANRIVSVSAYWDMATWLCL
jgi:predicted ester cyclase